MYRNPLLPTLAWLSLIALLLAGCYVSTGAPAKTGLKAAATADVQARLVVTIRGARSESGHYSCAVFDSRENFERRENPVRAARIPVSSKSVSTEAETSEVVTSERARWQVDVLEPGSYVIAVYHDANDNEKLDRHVLGFPIEAYGFSNNARGRIGPPRYENVVFEMTSEYLEMDIQLK